MSMTENDQKLDWLVNAIHAVNRAQYDVWFAGYEGDWSDEQSTRLDDVERLLDLAMTKLDYISAKLIEQITKES